MGDFESRGGQALIPCANLTLPAPSSTGSSGAIGPVEFPPGLPQNIPKSSVCLSSCAAYQAYRVAVRGDPPFQYVVGANRDVGWCQALIAFSSFYYLTGAVGKPVHVAVVSMNIGSGSVYEDGGPAFDAVNLYDEKPWPCPGADSKGAPSTYGERVPSARARCMFGHTGQNYPPAA